MNRQVLEEWAQALLSGQYQQIDYPLHTEEGFCKLGILCDVYRKKFGGEWTPAKLWCADVPPSAFLPRLEFLDCSYWPAPEIMKWLEVDCTCQSRERDYLRHLPGCEMRKFGELVVPIKTGLTLPEYAERLRAL